MECVLPPEASQAVGPRSARVAPRVRFDPLVESQRPGRMINSRFKPAAWIAERYLRIDVCLANT